MSDPKKIDESSHDSTVITSIEKLEADQDRKAYVLFLSGPLQGKLYCLDQEQTIVGRAEDVDIPINDTRISRHHFRISTESGKAFIEDLGSTNGTFVNGKRVKHHELQNGDKIQISSSTVIKFAFGDKGERMFHDEFYQMANFDAVTNIYNKRFFNERFKEEFSHAKRNTTPFSLIMIDIDFFKKINDTHGHLAGDFILAQVAQAIKSTIRGEDILARYGGEEFAVVLRGIELAGATLLAERIRKNLEDAPATFEEKKIPVTISAGVASLSGDNFTTPADLIAAADEQLYHSKQNGRNRVSSATS
ncbi:MAG: GGDEF domain-containing protein [Deltaproteobacteria bacterium]|nr:GGDEF domain-containing protein [Deltaproteobacteria bacterium]